MKSQSIFEALPTEIIDQITSRMSFKSIINCKLVCKTWLSLISQPYFTKLHLSRIITNNTALNYDNVILFVDRSDDKNRILRSVGDKDRAITFDIKNLHPLSDSELNIKFAGSCNGLICFFSTNKHRCDGDIIETPYLYNPVLGQCVALPKPSPRICNKYESCVMCDYQLGFCPNTNEYKLVRIVAKMSSIRSSREQVCEILSIGSAKHEWRCLGKVPKIRGWLPKMCTTVFVNSSIHWLVSDLQIIVSFNIENEKFGSIPTPFTHGYEIMFQLGVVDKCLAFTSKMSTWAETVDVWIMQEYGVQKSWIKKWSLETRHFCIDYLQPVKGSSDGQIIFLSCCRNRPQVLYSYHPEDKYILTRIFAYTPTFVSPMEVAGTRLNN